MTVRWIKSSVVAVALSFALANLCSAMESKEGNGGDRGGGDDIEMQLYVAGGAAVKILENELDRFPGVRADKLEEALKANVQATDETLYDSNHHDKAAINDRAVPPHGLIRVNRTRWRRIYGPQYRMALALHEYLSLARYEHSGYYAISAKVMNVDALILDSDDPTYCDYTVHAAAEHDVVRGTITRLIQEPTAKSALAGCEDFFKKWEKTLNAEKDYVSLYGEYVRRTFTEGRQVCAETRAIELLSVQFEDGAGYPLHGKIRCLPSQTESDCLKVLEQKAQVSYTQPRNFLVTERSTQKECARYETGYFGPGSPMLGALDAHKEMVEQLLRDMNGFCASEPPTDEARQSFAENTKVQLSSLDSYFSQEKDFLRCPK